MTARSQITLVSAICCLAGCVAVATAVAAYAPAMHGGFLFDDRFEIVANPALEVLWPPWIAMFTGGSQPHRPIPYYTLAVNHAWGGLDPWGYHAVNLGIHLVNAGLAWWVVRQALRQASAAGNLRRLGPQAIAASSLVTAAIWLCHPLCTQAVSYVYQRMESLAAMSVLVTVGSFLRSRVSARPLRWQAAAVLAAAVGPLCKESAAAAALCVAWLEVTLAPHRDRVDVRTAIAGLTRQRWLLLGLVATWLVAGWVVWQQRGLYSEFGGPGWTPWQYLVSQPRSIARYLRLAFWPAGQQIDYLWVPPVDLAEQLPGWLVVTLLVAVVGFGLRRAPPLAAAIGTMLLLLAPTSTILPVADLCVEHRMYLPLVPLVAAVVVGGGIAVGRVFAAEEPAARDKTVAVTVLAVGMAVAMALATVTWTRNHAYRSERAMWEAVLAADPAHQRAAMILAGASSAEGDFERTEAICRRALTGTRQFVPLQARLLTLLALATPQNGGPLEKAIGYARRATMLAPNLVETHLAVGDLLFENDRPGAEAAYRRALEIDPDHAKARAAIQALQGGPPTSAAE